MGGWILSFFRGHFVNLTPPTRPVLLILDGHSSHINLVNTAKFARANGVLLYCLPPMHALQPVFLVHLKEKLCILLRFKE